MSVAAKTRSYQRRQTGGGSQMAPMPSMDQSTHYSTNVSGGVTQNLINPSQNTVMIEATGIVGDNIFKGSLAEKTLKTDSIQNLPCGHCLNFVSTIPVESKFPICSIPPCGGMGFLIIMNKCDPWYKRLEHICPNCGTILMVCNKPFV